MRESEILVEQQPPQGVFVCDHAGLVNNKFSPQRRGAAVGIAGAARLERVPLGVARAFDQFRARALPVGRAPKLVKPKLRGRGVGGPA